MNKNKLAFTLVELIVVVTILALLSTIGFVSYSSYLSGVRDTNRLSQLVAISDGLELYKTKKTLPIPDDNIEIRANGTVIGYQGYAGINVLETIDYSKTGKDPKDKTYFSYYLTQDKKYYQLLTYLEEEENLETNNNLFSKTYADIDYTNRYPKVSGKKLGILTQSGTNIPVQEVTTIVSGGYLDLDTNTEDYIANLDDINTISGTGKLLVAGATRSIAGTNKRSCKDILEKHPETLGVDGIYEISPTSTETIKVDCDMTTDSGGWIKITEDDIVNNKRISLENLNYNCYKLTTEISGNKVIYFEGLCSNSGVGGYNVSMTTIDFPFSFTETKGNITAYQYGGTNPAELYSDYGWGNWQQSCDPCYYGMFHLGSDVDGRNKLVSGFDGALASGSNIYKEWSITDNGRSTNKFKIQVGENGPDGGETVYLDDVNIWFR